MQQARVEVEPQLPASLLAELCPSTLHAIIGSNFSVSLSKLKIQILKISFVV